MRARIVAPILAAFCLAAAVPATATAPSVRVTRELPLTVRGTGFHARELVAVTVRMNGGQWKRGARATYGGVFVVRFNGLRLRSCEGPVTIMASGTRTGVVRARIPARDCPAP